MQKETEILHARLRDIAQAIINDDQAFGASVSIDEKLNSLSCTSPRSRSPVKRPVSGSRPTSRAGSPFADATLTAVQAALNKRQLQIHELKTKLDNSRETNVAFKKQLDDADNERRKFEQAVGDLRSQLEALRRSLDDTSRERDQSRLQLETTNYEKSNLEKVRAVSVLISSIFAFFYRLKVLRSVFKTSHILDCFVPVYLHNHMNKKIAKINLMTASV